MDFMSSIFLDADIRSQVLLYTLYPLSAFLSYDRNLEASPNFMGKNCILLENEVLYYSVVLPNDFFL